MKPSKGRQSSLGPGVELTAMRAQTKHKLQSRSLRSAPRMKSIARTARWDTDGDTEGGRWRGVGGRRRKGRDSQEKARGNSSGARSAHEHCEWLHPIVRQGACVLRSFGSSRQDCGRTECDPCLAAKPLGVRAELKLTQRCVEQTQGRLVRCELDTD